MSWLLLMSPHRSCQFWDSELVQILATSTSTRTQYSGQRNGHLSSLEKVFLDYSTSFYSLKKSQLIVQGKAISGFHISSLGGIYLLPPIPYIDLNSFSDLIILIIYLFFCCCISTAGEYISLIPARNGMKQMHREFSFI